jgi:hypothetical protein
MLLRREKGTLIKQLVVSNVETSSLKKVKEDVELLNIYSGSA